MRRGHSGTGGWRNENHRHFVPRGGGGPHFRPSRTFGPSDTSRFQPPGPRYRGPYPHIDDRRQDNHERFHGAGHQPRPQRPQERAHHSRSMLPYIQKIRQDNDHNYNNQNYYDEGNNKYAVNKMGDIDLRQTSGAPQNHDSYGQRQISLWANPPFESRPYYNDHRTPHKTPRHQGLNESILPLNDYTGHRPPASDHYAATPGPNNNNTPYSRSVDDTVDIVRKRLMNRDSQQHVDEPSVQQELDEDLRMLPSKDYHVPQEQPVKKRNPKHRPNIKSNCDKMKNKIVHQLFKMDKGKIHKLMDNPSSSSKFEYAISSLITESQNSLNRHLRSVAEKSLECNSSSDFINNDNNTIYEDTFMKQMQCILDPQDTVLLEDIKPLVLAELSKVLQLDDFQRYEETEDQNNHSQEDQVQYPYHQENNYQYPNNAFYEADHPDHVDNNEGNDFDYNAGSYNNEVFEETETLFERRPARYERTQERLTSNESRQSRISIDRTDKLERVRTPAPIFERANTPAPIFERAKTPATVLERPQSPKPVYERAQTPGPVFERRPTPGPVLERAQTPRPVFERAQTPGPIFERPVFDPNMEQLSEDDDPFAELDKQYHVAVDHNFIENEDAVISLISPTPSKSSPRRENRNFSPHTSTELKKELDNQLYSMATSPLKLFSPNSGRDKNNYIKTEVRENKREIPLLEKGSEEPRVYEKSESAVPKVNEPVPPDSSKSTSKPNSRKRSIDQKASHRKEKRKKSSHSESQDPAKSIYNMFFPNTQSKETSKTSKKESSEKFVKRQEIPKKLREPESTKSDSHKKQNTSSHSMLSPNDSTSKTDSKTKLTSIDLFIGQPKKSTNVHQAHRNTATPLTVAKSPDENKIKVISTVATSFARKLSKRHVGTQVVKKYRDKDIQTDKYKNTTRGTQTEAQLKTSQSKDPFERMKEIDLEIQVLLQEKFKLYNSLESRSSNGSSTMESLGMTVLNMPVDENEERVSEENSSTTEDTIVDDFTSIPVEELEQIALETVQNKKVPKRRAQEPQQSFESPTPKRTNRKSKTPNISLLEQIITDDRPLEDIISLETLETTPVKSKRKSQKSAPKRKSSKKPNKQMRTINESNLVKENNIKDCSVILIRTDLNKFLNQYAQNQAEKASIEVTSSKDKSNNKTKQSPYKEEIIIKVEHLKEESISLDSDSQETDAKIEETVLENMIPDTELIEESVVNDIQFDMLDVSEDIVIGDSCEVKEKESEKVEISVGVILDNSQSSIEDSAPESSMAKNECKMYDYSTDENLKRDSMTVLGNADAVLAIECIENDFIAACLDGNVYHFSGDGRLINNLRGSNLAVTCLTIVKEKYGTTVYTGSLDSRIRYYDLETGLEKGPECNVLSPIQTMDRAWDTVFVGTRTGFVLQFECKNNMLIPVSTVKFSEQSILALRAMKEGARKVLLVAARSEDVTIKDAQTGLLLRTLVGPKMTVYTLLFEDGKVYCGTSSHRIHVFDYTSGSHVGCHEGGKGAVCLRAAGGLVFAGCYDGCVYVYREGDTRPLAQLRGPSLMLLSLALHGTKIIAGYKDRSLYIWKIPLPILQEMIL